MNVILIVFQGQIRLHETEQTLTSHVVFHPPNMYDDCGENMTPDCYEFDFSIEMESDLPGTLSYLYKHSVGEAQSIAWFLELVCEREGKVHKEMKNTHFTMYLYSSLLQNHIIYIVIYSREKLWLHVEK